MPKTRVAISSGIRSFMRSDGSTLEGASLLSTLPAVIAPPMPMDRVRRNLPSEFTIRFRAPLQSRQGLPATRFLATRRSRFAMLPARLKPWIPPGRGSSHASGKAIRHHSQLSIRLDSLQNLRHLARFLQTTKHDPFLNRGFLTDNRPCRHDAHRRGTRPTSRLRSARISESVPRLPPGIDTAGR